MSLLHPHMLRLCGARSLIDKRMAEGGEMKWSARLAKKLHRPIDQFVSQRCHEPGLIIYLFHSYICFYFSPLPLFLLLVALSCTDISKSSLFCQADALVLLCEFTLVLCPVALSEAGKWVVIPTHPMANVQKVLHIPLQRMPAWHIIHHEGLVFYHGNPQTTVEEDYRNNTVWFFKDTSGTDG